MATTAAGDWRAKVHQELRRHRPAAVAVFDEDGEQKVYKASGGERGRWSRLVEGLPAEWSRLELRDKDDATLWGLDSPTSAGVAAPMQLGKGGPVDQVSALLKLMLQAQDVALARQGESIARLTQGYQDLAGVLTARLTSLENLVSTVLQTAYDATLLSAEAQAQLSGDGNGRASKGEEMFAQFLGIKGRALGILPKVPNGAARKPAARPPAPTPPAKPSAE